MKFVPCRIPETGARWDAPESALAVHPTLERLDQPAEEQADRSKTKKPKAADAAHENKE